MGRTRIRLLLAALLLVPVLLYWGAGNTPSEATSLAAPDASIDRYTRDITVIQYGTDGNITRQITASQVEHRLDTSYYTAPVMQRFTDTGDVRISALRGQMADSQQELAFYGQVQLYKQNEAGKVLQVQTEQMDYLTAQETAVTEHPVIFTAPGHQVSATGMRANMSTGQIDLLSDVKGLHQYEK